MDTKRIKELIKLMKDNDLSEMQIQDDQVRILLRRGLQEAQTTPAVVPGAGAAAVPPVIPAQANTDQQGQGSDDLKAIESPMVGTFYAAADPESPPLAKVGDHVNADTVVCIVEAMKVFNEIKAEISGTIEKILLSNEQPVEYGQEMFLVRPD